MDDTLRSIFDALIPVHLLHHAADAPASAEALAQELSRHGYEVSSHSLGPALDRLEERGYLAKGVAPTGERGQEYRITDDGITALAHARAKLVDLVMEVLGQRPANEELAI